MKGCIKAKDSCGQPKQLPDSNIDKTEDQRIDASLDGQKIQPQAAKIKVIPGVEKTIDFKVTVSLITKESGCVAILNSHFEILFISRNGP